MVSLQNQITVRFLQGDRKGLSLLCKTILANAPEPRTDSLAHIAKDLGYTESSDYVRINSYVTNILVVFGKGTNDCMLGLFMYYSCMRRIMTDIPGCIVQFKQDTRQQQTSLHRPFVKLRRLLNNRRRQCLRAF